MGMFDLAIAPINNVYTSISFYALWLVSFLSVNCKFIQPSAKLVILCWWSFLFLLLIPCQILRVSTMSPTLSMMGNDYQPKGCEALWLGCKGRLVYSTCG